MKKNYCAPLHKLIPFLTLFLIIGCSTTETPIDENVLDDDEETVIDNPDDSGNNSDSGEEVAPTDFYRFTTYQTSTADPFDVNVLFQVSDSMFRGVPNLMIEDLRITENDEESPIDESKATLFDRNSFELEMRTALLIDVSNSIQTDFVTLKEELKTLIDGALPFQEIAIYTFSSTTELVQDYSTDKEQLKGTIDNLQLGTSSTDFYGAVVTAANSFTNGFVENEVTVGNLIIFTDGDDTQASNTFTAAKEALIDKNAYVVGLSSADLDEDNIKNLFGDSFYFPSETIGRVNESFGLIQTEIENYANSVYLLNYETPKRGDNNHYLKIYHKENSNDGADHYAVGEFVSTGFYEPVAPTAATLISPSISEEITLTNTCSVTFEVGKSIDENLTANDEITYEFYFGDSETTLELIDSRTVPATQETISFESPSGLIPNSNYLWQIKTKDDDFEELDILSDLAEFKYVESIYTASENLNVYSNDFSNTCYTKVYSYVVIGDIEGETITNSFQGFPYLTEINGSLAFNNVSTIDFFPALSVISGQLGIGFHSSTPNNSLTSINGLDNLENVRYIQISGNVSLKEIEAFKNLKTLEGLRIYKNPVLERIDGFHQIVEMVGPSYLGSLQIIENISLQELNVFENLEIVDVVWLRMNDKLLEFKSLVSLQEINNNLDIELNPSLQSVNLPKLRSVTERIKIEYNDSLKVASLPNLQSVGVVVSVQNNANLSVLELSNKTQINVGRQFIVRANPLLFDMCYLTELSITEWNPNNAYMVEGNGYNPTLEELTNGNCKP